MAQNAEVSGPDLEAGIDAAELADGSMLEGHVGDDPVLIARVGDEVLAIGARCTHYGAPLAEGILVGDSVRCPWHHACFSLRTGEATCAPALDPVQKWTVVRHGSRFAVDIAAPKPDGASPLRTARAQPQAIVVVGAGAAGNAAAEMLRREGYEARLTLIGADPSPPYDRPNLSKEYLAGKAPEEWIPLRPKAFYADHGIELLTNARVAAIEITARRVLLESGHAFAFDRLLIATGAEPVRLRVPGGDGPHVHYLRTLADSRSIIAASSNARRAVVVGASFIGLEVAASLRQRGLDVTVVAPESVPLERVMGAEIGTVVRQIHEQHGVKFSLGRTLRSVESGGVVLDDGSTVPAELVVIGVGVKPATALAERAGIGVGDGIVVDEHLETSVAGIFAAGDVASYTDARTRERLRVEHWVVAERQGQAAARNMLGARQPYWDVPFFWSAHFDSSIRYVGHATAWDATRRSGDLRKRDFAVSFVSHGRTLAVATMGRDAAALRAEVALARGDQNQLDALVTGR